MLNAGQSMTTVLTTLNALAFDTTGGYSLRSKAIKADQAEVALREIFHTLF
jgi:hypothetical protein